MSYAIGISGRFRRRRTATWRAIGIALTAAAFSGCGLPDAQGVFGADRHQHIDPALAGGAPEAGPLPAFAAANPRLRPAVPVRRTATGVATGIPAVAAEDLLGGGASGVLSVLGEPLSRVADQSAQLWRYVVDDCDLRLLFFFDVASDRYRLAMIRQNDVALAGHEPVNCLSEVADAGFLS